jgi:hypothetical protein
VEVKGRYWDARMAQVRSVSHRGQRSSPFAPLLAGIVGGQIVPGFGRSRSLAACPRMNGPPRCASRARQEYGPAFFPLAGRAPVSSSAPCRPQVVQVNRSSMSDVIWPAVGADRVR